MLAIDRASLTWESQSVLKRESRRRGSPRQAGYITASTAASTTASTEAPVRRRAADECSACRLASAASPMPPIPAAVRCAAESASQAPVASCSGGTVAAKSANMAAANTMPKTWAMGAAAVPCTIQRSAATAASATIAGIISMPTASELADKAAATPASRGRTGTRQACNQRPDQQHELYIVMIDCPGAKVLQHRCTQRGQNERKPRRRLIGETACEPCDASKKDKEEGNRPQRDDEVFRPTARQHDLRSSDEHRERQVDETRPVHHHAVRRVEPVLGEIKPALAGQEVTHLHESH